MFKFLNTATLRIEELRVTTKSLRIKRNLGKMDKTPSSAISRWISGTRISIVEDLDKLANIFQVNSI